MRNILFSLAIAVGLVACASTTTSTTDASPATIVFQAKTAYATALVAAVTYKNLPKCASPAVQPCSDPAIVAQLQKADNVAAVALDTAEAAVRTPAIGTDAISKAVSAGQMALQAFVAISTNLRIK